MKSILLIDNNKVVKVNYTIEKKINETIKTKINRICFGEKPEYRLVKL